MVYLPLKTDKGRQTTDDRQFVHTHIRHTLGKRIESSVAYTELGTSFVVFLKREQPTV
jgi:hypothetical protein